MASLSSNNDVIDGWRCTLHSAKKRYESIGWRMGCISCKHHDIYIVFDFGSSALDDSIEHLVIAYKRNGCSENVIASIDILCNSNNNNGNYKLMSDTQIELMKATMGSLYRDEDTYYTLTRDTNKTIKSSIMITKSKSSSATIFMANSSELSSVCSKVVSFK
jgi:hypothetical protein